jgi:hypothetical protein
MRFIPLFLSSAVLLAGLSSLHAQTTPLPAKPGNAQQPAQAAALLPDAFAGWQASGATKAVTEAVVADPAAAAALKEYGFTDGTLASYKHGDETLTLRALRFEDASGAYGAYSFYRPSGWPKAEIGTGAASNGNRVFFWVGNIVIDATFSQIGPMSGAQLRELAGALPAPGGTKAIPPPILGNLPKDALDGQTTHYAVGPSGYAGAGGVLPPDLAGFDRGAEAVTASYTLRSGPATLTIIDYPTPQMATAQESRIRDYIKAGDSPAHPWTKPLKDSSLASLEVRRSGTLVALVSGDAIPDESHKLLQQVNFDADLKSVSDPQQANSEIARTGKLLLGIVTLVLIGSGAAILLGLFLGGGRALYRVARGKPASSLHEAEFISLHLED